MFRLFYRYMRRVVHQLTNGDRNFDVMVTVSKWWFDNARNLVISAAFAYYATRTGSWLAYVLTQIRIGPTHCDVGWHRSRRARMPVQPTIRWRPPSRRRAAPS
jgi:hypothetical protein